MAESVIISNSKDIGKQVRKQLERRGGKLNSIESKLDALEGELDGLENIEGRIKELNERVTQLQQRIEEIEQTKASAQRQAVEGLKDDLHDQLEEKRQEYQRRLGEVLDDYRGAVERLKDRFLGSISGREEQFEQVEDEFRVVQERREACVETTAETSHPATSNYQVRLDAIIQSRNGFLGAIDDFLADREDTAATIDSLQTQVPGVSDTATIIIPFWVVGIRKSGHEEVRVHPILDRSDRSSSQNPDRAAPYAEYLREHPIHSYGDMTDMVHTYAIREVVRDALASRDGEFVDPSFLRQSDAVMDRFVNALEEFELEDRPGGGGHTRSGDGTDQQSEAVDREEVPADG